MAVDDSPDEEAHAGHNSENHNGAHRHPVERALESIDRGKDDDEEKAAAGGSQPFRQVFAGISKSPATLDHLVGVAFAVGAPGVVERMPAVGPLDAVLYRSVTGRQARRDNQAAIADLHTSAVARKAAGFSG